MKLEKKRWLPLVILAAGLAVVALLFATRPVVEPEPPDVPAPLVRAVTATPEAVQFTVRAHGTVVPRTESELVPQVAGEVIWVSPSLVSGGFFEAGDPLLRIDPADAEVELESARASVARAESEERRARVERDRQRSLADRSVTSQSRIDDAENAYRVAVAGLREARARLARAERDRARTELRAPYTGRVRSESVDPGQFVARGQSIATLYAVDYAEVRLPIPDRELRYLDLPLHPELDPASVAERAAARLEEQGAEREPPVGPEVELRAEFAGVPHTWTGTIVRTEGEIDPKSRMVHAVARVADPYGLLREARAGEGDGAGRSDTSGAGDPASRPDMSGAGDPASRPDARGAGDRIGGAPLAVGLFVEAEIQGRRLEEAMVLPRTALRAGDRVWVIDEEDRLRFRDVEVARAQDETVVIRSGLEPGERVCISSMTAVVDGMAVRVLSDEEDAEGAGALARTGS